jgi:hypothetical protein
MTNNDNEIFFSKLNSFKTVQQQGPCNGVEKRSMHFSAVSLLIFTTGQAGKEI